jgi:hypothetical protein
MKDTSAPPTTEEFASEWQEITSLIGREAEGALRIGQLLIAIRDELKPRGLWLAALREHGMSQPQASRYIRYAELPESDRMLWQRVNGFSLSAAVGEHRTKKDATEESGTGQAPNYSSTNSPEIPADELADRLEEIDQRLKLAVEMVSKGEEALAGEPQPEYAADDARWKLKLSEIAEDVCTVISAHLMKELERRVPCR